MWAECEAQPHTEESELFWDLYAESHVPKPCATFRRACWPSRRRPSRRPRVQMLGGDEFPQSGPLPALGVWTPLLQYQNRAHWDQLLIRRGLAALTHVEKLGSAQGQYVLQAEIAACHARARTPEETNWPRI